MKNFKVLIAAVTLFVLAGCVSTAMAADPADNGVWSSDQTLFQGFNVVYAETAIPAVVVFWYTYDENGNQAWFISDNIPVNSGRSEDTVSVFKPICTFADSTESCALGDAVGVLAYGRSGDRLTIRFGLSTALEGFSEDCAQGITVGPQVSPMPPPIPSEFGCQSRLVLSRISPAIPALNQ